MSNKYLYKRCKILLLLMNIMVLTFIACTSRQAPANESKIVEKPETPSTQAPWEQQWEGLIKAAQKEGRLSFISSLERDTAEALRKNFGKKYGIDMNIIMGRDEELSVKLYRERESGLYLSDLYMEGPTSPLLQWKPRGILKSLDKVVFRPDVLDEKLWWKGYGPYFDKDHMLGGGGRTVLATIAVNTKMVRPGEISSYNDLLDPRWKGKILVGDPTVSGGPAAVMINTLVIMGEDYIRKLAEQAGMLIRDKRLLVEWVVREKYPIAFGATDVIVQEFKREGVVNLDMIAVKEGSGVTSTGLVVLFDRAPHPDAARLFINWLLTKEGQEVYGIAASKMSRRLDVSDEHMAPYQRIKEGPKYILNDEDFYLKRPEYQVIINKYYK